MKNGLSALTQVQNSSEEELVGKLSYSPRQYSFNTSLWLSEVVSCLQVTKDESDRVRKLQFELAALRKQYNNKQDENSRSVNMLKCELENAKLGYEKRLQHLQLTRPDVEASETNEQLAQNRVKALET